MDATATLPQVLTALQVGLWLALSAGEVERMARAGRIPCRILPNGHIVFDPAELERWLAGCPMGGPDRA